MRNYEGPEPKIAWICPHGGGALRYHTEHWPEPIHSFSNWTRHTNAHLWYGQDDFDSHKKALAKYDGYFFMCSPGRLAEMIPKFKKEWPDKPVAVLTDGFSHDFVEVRHPESAFWNVVEDHVDLILGNRPDNERIWGALTKTPIEWLGFPCETEVADKHLVQIEDRSMDIITVFWCPGAMSAILAIERAFPGRFTFTMFKSPAHKEHDRRVLKNAKDWPEAFGGIKVKRWGDTPWNGFMKRSANAFLALQYDLAGGMGRFVTDMGALRIPTIASINVGRAPQITDMLVDPWKQGPSGCVNHIRALDAQDATAYRLKCDRAREKVDEIYGIGPSMERYRRVLDRLFPGWEGRDDE